MMINQLGKPTLNPRLVDSSHFGARMFKKCQKVICGFPNPEFHIDPKYAFTFWIWGPRWRRRHMKFPIGSVQIDVRIGGDMVKRT